MYINPYFNVENILQLKNFFDVFPVPRPLFILILSTFKQVFLAHNERYSINLLFYLWLKKVNLVLIYNKKIYTKMFTLC